MTYRSLMLCGCAAVLSACQTVGPDYAGPPTVAIDLSDMARMDAARLSPGIAVEAAWWARYDDPVLTELIETAARENLDIALALNRVEQARLSRQLVSLRGLPNVNSTAGAQRLRGSETALGFGPPPGAPALQNLFDLGASLRWELDLFGKIDRQTAAADRRVEASDNDRRAAMVAVFAEVGTAYAELRGLQAQYEISEENVSLLQRTLELTENLEGQGLGSNFDVVRARADLSELRASQNGLIGAQRVLAARLGVLTGQTPAQVMAPLLASADLPMSSAPIPIGLPSELLQRRPDIVAAERRLAAATETIGVETADLYPSFALTGAGGLQSGFVEDLVDTASRTWSVGAIMNWPVFDAGRTRGEIRLAESQVSEADLTYRKVVLDALGEVESALSNYVFTEKEIDSLETAVSDREAARDLAELRYRTGNDSLLPMLQASRRLTGLKAELAAKRQSALISQIAVYRSLGGGWEPFEATD
ncbi:MAG: efflux transporter outer membrane subunit [Litorimonas sp.]